MWKAAPMTSAVDSPVDSPIEPRGARDSPHQRAWYWYDWANSAYVTTTLTVLMAPYLTVIAKRAACPTLPSDVACPTNLSVVGIPVAPGSLVFYVLTFSTILSAIALIFIGAIADRSPRPVRLFGAFAWAGAAAATAMFLVSGDNWGLGVLLLVFANLCLGSSLVIYDSLLCRIAAPDERDRVSSRGWAWGYLGGGLLLALNLALLTLAGQIGISAGMAVRISLLSAGLWSSASGICAAPRTRSTRSLSRRPARLRQGSDRGWSAAAWDSSPEPSVSFASTRRRCSSWWHTSSSMTASRP
jgi:UMF1 family MFS transporter